MCVVLKNTKRIPLYFSLTLLCILIACLPYAQSATSASKYNGFISGTVIDSGTQVAMSHVTVTIYETGSIQPLHIVFTNDKGVFKIPIVSVKQHQLTVTSTGYKDLIVQLPLLTASFFDVGKIALVPLVQQLPEVRITTMKPLIQMDLDKLIYNVDADPESQSATTLDILRKIPMISIDADDNLQLNGTSSYRVLINGKPSLLFLHNPSDVFKSMSASAIKTIEVITVPSARYESQGVGGIINITTYKKSIGGYNGGLNLQTSNPKGYAVNGNLTASIGKISFGSHYGYISTSSPTNTTFFSRFDKTRMTQMEQTGSSNSNNHTQNYGSEVTYQLNDLNMITGGYILNMGNGRNNFIQNTHLYTGGGLLQAPSNTNASRNMSHGNDIALNYQRNFKKNSEQLLTLLYHFSNGTNKNNSIFRLVPLFNYADVVSITENTDASRESSLQADYVQPLKKHFLEVGISSVDRNSSSDYFYKVQDSITGAYILDTSQSNKFTYRERIYAGYISFYLKLGRWGLRSGARLEAANVDAQFISSGTITKRNYVNTMPNVMLSRQLKGISMIKASYSQSFNRPELYYLDPYVDRTDPWNISYGNPQLQPALAHIFSLGYTASIKKTFISIDVFHQFTNNAIQQITFLGADTIARTSFANIGQNKNLSVALAGNTTLFRKLSINLNSMVNYVYYRRVMEGKPQVNSGVTYNIGGTASLRLKNWHASTTMSYTAPAILTQGKTGGYTSSAISMNRYLLKNNKVNLGVAVSNPLLDHRNSVIELDDPSFHQLRKTIMQVRRYTVFVNYKFTKVQASNRRK